MRIWVSVRSMSKGNSSSMVAQPVPAVALMRRKPATLRNTSSCASKMSFSMSCGVAPGQEVCTSTTRVSRSGIICTRSRARAKAKAKASMPSTASSKDTTATSVPWRTTAAYPVVASGCGLMGALTGVPSPCGLRCELSWERPGAALMAEPPRPGPRAALHCRAPPRARRRANLR